MNEDEPSNPAKNYDPAEYERVVVNAALWSAAGDALGWMTELSRGPNGVRHRTGTDRVVEPVAWKRLIGGRTGVKVDLPAGTYSDDTQLRLCVSRSIRGNGNFDVEAFAKVEITVWQGYCLGAGIGSKAAATNLAKRGVNWFSNFFETDRQKYTTAGGNGAAMRIHPHVWSAQSSINEMVRQVLRDAIVTHGHPHGFCGAIFHALCVWDTLVHRKITSFVRAREFINYLEQLPHLIESDSELSQFWLPTWENETKTPIIEALKQFQIEALRDLEIVEESLREKPKDGYHLVLERLGCLTDRFRGSGYKTALAALALSAIFADKSIEQALAVSANELDSDTDTIATMAGALLGSLADSAPVWKIQDKQYLEDEARRLAQIAFKSEQQSFPYPDVSFWEPPSNQSDAVVLFNGSQGLAGFGPLLGIGPEYKAGNAVWQWFELPHGQTILAKRRAKIQTTVDAKQMPGTLKQVPTQSSKPEQKIQQKNLLFDYSDLQPEHKNTNQSLEKRVQERRFPGVDRATDAIIASGFDDATIGRILKHCIDETGSIEQVISLSAIVAKARLARMRRK